MVKVKYVESTTRSLELLNKLINLAGNSLKIKKIIVEEPYKEFNLRPQIHVFISAPFGEFKSTILQEIINHYGGKIITDITFASLVGSIDRITKQIIPAAVWECRNKPLILDEYSASRSWQVVDALLQLLEHQYYSRKVATYSADLNEEDGDLYFKVKSGNIEVKTRFSCICATMKNICMIRKQITEALLSRFIPIRYEMSEKEIDEVLDGKPLFKPEKLEVDPEVRIKLKDYQYIRDIIKKVKSKRKIKGIENILARTVNECCRCYAVLGKHDEKLYENILLLKARFT
jgi:hypothetical protein